MGSKLEKSTKREGGANRKIRDGSHFNCIQPQDRVISQSLRDREMAKRLGLAWDDTHSKSPQRCRDGQVELEDTARSSLTRGRG